MLQHATMRQGTTLQLAEKLLPANVLKGHDFSRAAIATKRTRALASEGTDR
jgi:hypothetical protein